MALLLCAWLAGCSSTAPAPAPIPDKAAPTEAAAADGYQVFVADVLGRPVKGALVQFGSDTLSLSEVTGKDGIAAFDSPAGQYTACLQEVPDGYAMDDAVYPVPETSGMVTIVLNLAPKKLKGTAALPETGLRLAFPYTAAKGTFQFTGNPCPPDEDGVSCGISTLLYISVPPEDFDTWKDYVTAAQAAEAQGEPLPEAPEARWTTYAATSAPLFQVVSLTGDYGDSAESWMQAHAGWNEGDSLREIGRTGQTVFYLLETVPTEEEKAAMQEAMGDFYAEYEALSADDGTFTAALTFSEPAD